MSRKVIVIGICLCGIGVFLWIILSRDQMGPVGQTDGAAPQERALKSKEHDAFELDPGENIEQQEEGAVALVATNQHVYAKSGVELGEKVFDIRYVEHEPPTLYRKLEPLSGPDPVWLKAAKTIDEYYNHDYQDMVDSMTTENLQMSRHTQERHDFMKQQYLDGEFDDIPELVERSLVSEMFVEVDDREYIIVKFDDYGWRESIKGHYSHGVLVEFYEKEDGLWKSTIRPSWYSDLSRTGSDLVGLLKGTE